VYGKVRVLFTVLYHTRFTIIFRPRKKPSLLQQPPLRLQLLPPQTMKKRAKMMRGQRLAEDPSYPAGGTFKISSSTLNRHLSTRALV
jgi:hypothetical protein